MSDPTVDPVGAVVDMVSAFKGGQAFLGVALLTLILVSLLRWAGKFLPGKVGAFFQSKAGGWVLAMVGGTGVSILAAAISGAPFSLSVLGVGLVAGFTAAGKWEGLRDAIAAVQRMRGVSPLAEVTEIMVPPAGGKSFGDTPSAEQIKDLDAMFAARGYTKQPDGTYKREQR